MPSAHVSAFLSKFDKVKATGGQHLVVCPGHPDKSPSLAVKEGSDGSILLKCHAGCPTERILAAMGLDASALFEPKDSAPKRTIHAEYSYHDEDGKLLFQAIRYTPKGFSQRRPDGNGWIYNLQGVRRVVYRLPELLGQKAILFVEGEKDADAAWKLGIPATCNPMGAGKWDQSYAHQILKQGAQRVAVIPDNDAPGAAHAVTVTAGLQAVGLEVRLVPLPGVPDHGDLSDYLAIGHSKEDLLALVKASPLADRVDIAPKVQVEPRRFTSLGEQRYVMDIHPEGISLEVNRLRRSSQELTGELIVKVNGHFPNARTFSDGVLNAGDLNFSSVQARSTRAKLLGDRAGDKQADWYGFLEEFVTTVIAHERRGKPAEILADVESEDESAEAWTISGFPLLRQLPQVLFGDSASGKSYFAMWLAGKLAQDGIPVLYADWEFSKSEHKKRLGRLFQPMPKNLLYIRCDHSLKHETDHLLDVIQTNKIQYIICDSIGFAVDGPAESQEGAAGYFRYLRQLRIGSLNVAHIPKQYDDGREAQIFGSIFFKNGARSVWFIERAKENPPGELRFGLYHRKNNVGALLKPKGFKLVFRSERTAIETIDLDTVDELAGNLPVIERMKRALESGAMTLKGIAEEIDAPVPTVRSNYTRHKSAFVKIGNKIGLTEAGARPVEPPHPADSGVEF